MKRLKSLLGVDGAIAYTFLARLAGIVGSTGTVLLIARSLTPEEQGFYYTLLSLVSLQLVFELGFSFVLQQLAAHESVHLEFGVDGAIHGEQRALVRLASILKIILRWYSLAAVAMVVVLVPAGYAFFAAQNHGAVAWQWPWITAACASAIGLWATPLYSFLEGMGEVRAVAAMRFRQSVAAALMAWGALLLHEGLYAPALVIVGQTATGLWFVAGRSRRLRALLHVKSSAGGVSWMSEVWPFQWRIAVSWLCTYFTAQVFVPILFTRRGPIEAGQMGMSLSVTGYMIVLVLAWSSTKATPFGQMIARREFHALDHLYLRTLRHSLVVFALIAIVAVGGVVALTGFAPRLAARMLPPASFALLVLAASANCIVQSLATLLRAFKQEPFLVQSLWVAGVTVALGWLTAARWGAWGTAWSYLLATGGIALPSAIRIYLARRREYLKQELPPTLPEGELA